MPYNKMYYLGVARSIVYLNPPGMSYYKMYFEYCSAFCLFESSLSMKPDMSSAVSESSWMPAMFYERLPFNKASLSSIWIFLQCFMIDCLSIKPGLSSIWICYAVPWLAMLSSLSPYPSSKCQNYNTYITASIWLGIIPISRQSSPIYPTPQPGNTIMWQKICLNLAKTTCENL